MKTLPGLLLLLLATMSALTSLGTLLAGIFALGSQETIVAIESLFGSVIAALLFAVLTRKLYAAGMARIKSAHNLDSNPTL